MNESLDRIKERIRRCLALGDASRNPSEHEAETAMRMARSLMDRYNLAMADVVEKSGEIPGTLRTQRMRERASPPRWEMRLARVCDLLFSTYHFESVGWPEYKRTIVFVGYDDDVALAAEVYKLLKLELLPMGLRWARANDLPELTWNQNRYRRCVYLEGVVQTLENRARQMSEEMTKEQAGRITALVVRKQDNAKTWATKEFHLQVKHSRGTSMHNDAFGDGMADGKKVSLDFKGKVKGQASEGPKLLGGGNQC